MVKLYQNEYPYRSVSSEIDTIQLFKYYLADVEDLETNTYYIDSRWAESFTRTILA